MEQGFRPKYSIMPVNELAQDVLEALLFKEFFVLKPFNDPAAWFALKKYAEVSQNEKLAEDLLILLKESAESLSEETLGDEGKNNRSLIPEIKDWLRSVS